MNKKKFAIAALLLLVAPLLLYNFIDLLQGYIPPTEPYKKTPYQFEEAFNEQMRAYGMTIDVDSVLFTYNDTVCYKTVPIFCEDGSAVSCTYFPTSERHKSLIVAIEFEQQLKGTADEKVYLVPLMEFIMQEFETPMAADKDKTFFSGDAASYNEALQDCQDFISGTEKELEFNVACEDAHASTVTLTRETGDTNSIKIRVYLWS